MANRKNPPTRQGKGQIPDPPVPADFNKTTPKFCLRHLHADHCVKTLAVEKRADFAMALQDRAAMTWEAITLAGKHGLGSELIPAKKIKAPIPTSFKDSKNFVVLRYSGMLPMVGVRRQDVFHILWIEAKFNDVYDHG